MSCCHFGSEGYDCDCLRDEQFEKIEKLEADIERSFKKLEWYGVPRERARSVSNGIQVLITRMDKQITALEDQIAREDVVHQKLEILEGQVDNHEDLYEAEGIE